MFAAHSANPHLAAAAAADPYNVSNSLHNFQTSQVIPRIFSLHNVMFAKLDKSKQDRFTVGFQNCRIIFEF